MPGHRRSVLLINRKFQLRFCLYICGCFVSLCFIYPLIVTTLFDYFIRVLEGDPNGPAVQVLFNMRREVLTLIVLTEIAFTGATFLISLFISHRIAGPLYKLRRTFDELGHGKWNRTLSFRKRDYFPELADDFNRMVEMIRERSRKDEELLTIALSRIEAAMSASPSDARAELEPAWVALRKLKERRAESPAEQATS